MGTSNYRLAFTDKLPEEVLGATSASDSTIYINADQLSSYDTIVTIAHESYHAYQNNQITGKSPLTEPKCYIIQWADELNNYDSGGGNSYYNQYLELSAEWFAGGLDISFYDGFTGYGYYIYYGG